jgi:hypothetical protein
MTAVDFIDWFRAQLHGARIEFALTSGQACVYFGIQQTTEDSDWIIKSSDLPKLVDLFRELERQSCRVQYRTFCGAPLDGDYLSTGWTSHLSLYDSAGTEHHLDFFGKPPRVTRLERDLDQPDYASRLTVAQMKKTDREKDWPIVYSLGRQAFDTGNFHGILYGMESDWLLESWPKVPVELRPAMVLERPLLRWIDEQPSRLRRGLMMEKYFWSAVNRGRYNIYARAWKDFYHQWSLEPDFCWPLNRPFEEQHQRLGRAAQQHELPTEVLETKKAEIVQRAKVETMDVFAAPSAELDELIPPLEFLLP